MQLSEKGTVQNHFITMVRRPIYGKTAMEGHFGVEELPWEQTDLVPELKKLANI